MCARILFVAADAKQAKPAEPKLVKRGHVAQPLENIKITLEIQRDDKQPVSFSVVTCEGKIRFEDRFDLVVAAGIPAMEGLNFELL